MCQELVALAFGVGAQSASVLFGLGADPDRLFVDLPRETNSLLLRVGTNPERLLLGFGAHPQRVFLSLGLQPCQQAVQSAECRLDLVARSAEVVGFAQVPRDAGQEASYRLRVVATFDDGERGPFQLLRGQRHRSASACGQRFPPRSLSFLRTRATWNRLDDDAAWRSVTRPAGVLRANDARHGPNDTAP